MPANRPSRKDSELDASLVFNLLLERAGKVGKALICHNVQNVDVLILDPLAVLIDA